MSVFSETLNVNQTRFPRLKQIFDALEALNDGSADDFNKALQDKTISQRELCRAITQATGIKVSNTTIHEWRAIGASRENL